MFGIAAIPGVVYAAPSVLALQPGKAAAENGFDADAGHIASLPTTAAAWVINAYLVLGTRHRRDAVPAARHVGACGPGPRCWCCWRGVTPADARAVLAACTFRVRPDACLAFGAGSNAKAAGPAIVVVG